MLLDDNTIERVELTTLSEVIGEEGFDEPVVLLVDDDDVNMYLTRMDLINLLKYMEGGDE